MYWLFINPVCKEWVCVWYFLFGICTIVVVFKRIIEAGYVSFFFFLGTKAGYVNQVDQ